MRIYLLRHGQTEMNKELRIQGRINTELSEVGLAQAENIRRVIENAGIAFTNIYCSPLKRAVKTCEIVTGKISKDFILDDRLMEMKFGAMEGVKYTELSDEMKALFNAPENYNPDPTAESFDELEDRLARFLNDIKELPENAEVLVTSHGAAIHGILSMVKNKERKDFWDEEVHNCDINVLKYKDGSFFATGEKYFIPNTIVFDFL